MKFGKLVSEYQKYNRYERQRYHDRRRASCLHHDGKVSTVVDGECQQCHQPMVLHDTGIWFERE